MPVRGRFEFKILLITFKAIKGLPLKYPADLIAVLPFSSYDLRRNNNGILSAKSTLADNPRTCTQILIRTVVQGGGGWCNLSLEFLICCSILKRFCLQWKAFDLLNKISYILWVVVLMGACDVTNNCRHLGFYQELEIRLRPQEMIIFCVLHVKWHINKHFASFYPQSLPLLLKEFEKTWIFA